MSLNKMYLKNFLLFIFSVAVLTFSYASTITSIKTARIYGKLPQGTELKKDDVFSLLDRMSKLPLNLDNEGNFDITINLDKPTYFSLSRNPIYLSPGDNLEVVHLDSDPLKSIFKGKGMEANTYLSHRMYAKGGSYLESGKNVTVDFQQTLSRIDSIRAFHIARLRNLKNVTNEFKDLEDKRIKADYINSILYYPNYRENLLKRENVPTKEEYESEILSYYSSIKPLISPLLKELSSDDQYLDIEVVRLNLYRASGIKAFNLNVSERFNAFIEASNELNKLRKEVSPSIYEEMLVYSDKIIYQDIKQVYLERLNSSTSLMKGKEAPDFVVVDQAGNKKLLSDYKGKVLYVDFWATWCMPCLAEAPYFKALSKEYKDIHFISISIDDKRETWDKFLAQVAHTDTVTELFSIDPDLRSKWNIIGIPRFLLIDENFKIISDAAARPSDKKSLQTQLDNI